MITILSMIVGGAILTFVAVRPGPVRMLGRVIASQFHKGVTKIRALDPIAEMKMEVDRKIAKLLDGRKGLQISGALLARADRVIETGKDRVAKLEGEVKSYLMSGDRQTAARLVLQLQQTKKDLEENIASRDMNKAAFDNDVEKLRFAQDQVSELRARIERRDANLRSSRVNAEVARLRHELDVDVTTDLGQADQIVQDEIDANNAEVQVSAALSGNGIDSIRRAQDVRKQQAELALQAFEKQIGHEAPIDVPIETKLIADEHKVPA